MKKEFAMSLSQSYRQDLLDAIQLAEQGMLSPSQQAYCFEEIEDTKGTALYPADGDELFCQLRTALGEKTQISERQRAEGELHKLGVELFFHTYIDRFTFAEITHNTAAHKYDAIIYLDERVTNEEKCANAAAMRRAFDAWLDENGLTADPTALTEVPDPCEGRFDTLAGAIAHIDHILHFPDLLLI
ncbi:MAG: hypothetical protein ACLUOA_08820 [Gemmiger formicilis]|jgi:hypothetical protein|uniref:hypothetical protein n=1 Tax=Gemmiger formicilis TaxID=745368 RepID=UPI00399177B7